MKRLTKTEIDFIKELANRGISLNQIVKRTGLKKTTIYYHTKKIGYKVKKVVLNNLSDWETGYLIGLFVSDGNLDIQPKTGHYGVCFNLNAIGEDKIISEITHILNKSNLRSSITKHNNLIKVRCLSKQLYLFLNSLVVYNNILGQNKKCGMKNYENWNEQKRLGFIAGYLDGDGCLTLDKGKYLRVLISTSRSRLAKNLKICLDMLNIKSTIQFDKRGKYILRISTRKYIQRHKQINCVKGRWRNGR